jgi:hypothetical protein
MDIGISTLAVPVGAQTGGSSGSAPVAGLANITVGGGVTPWQSGASSFWNLGLGYAPFVNDHLQLGGGLSYSGSSTSRASQTIGASANARYLFGNDPRSAPFVAAAIGETGGLHRFGIFTASAALGWLRFLTPLTAVDARFQVVANSAPGSKVGTSFSASPQAFVSGVFGDGSVGPQQRGAFDWSASVNIPFSPHYGGSLNANYDPFIASWFQVGIGGGASFTPAQDGLAQVTSYSGDALARAYYPEALPIQPFVEVFGNATTARSPDRYDTRTHGASIGVRHYISPELAFDVRLLTQRLDNIVTFAVTGGRARFTSHTTSTELAFGLTLHQPAH